MPCDKRDDERDRTENNLRDRRCLAETCSGHQPFQDEDRDGEGIPRGQQDDAGGGVGGYEEVQER